MIRPGRGQLRAGRRITAQQAAGQQWRGGMRQEILIKQRAGPVRVLLVEFGIGARQRYLEGEALRVTFEQGAGFLSQDFRLIHSCDTISA
jgi:hypothetical protein